MGGFIDACDMSEECGLSTAHQCVCAPKHCSVRNISITYKVNSKISHYLLLTFHLVEAKTIFCYCVDKTELLFHNKQDRFLCCFFFPKENCNAVSMEFTKFNRSFKPLYVPASLATSFTSFTCLLSAFLNNEIILYLSLEFSVQYKVDIRLN